MIRYNLKLVLRHVYNAKWEKIRRFIVQNWIVFVYLFDLESLAKYPSQSIYLSQNTRQCFWLQHLDFGLAPPCKWNCFVIISQRNGFVTKPTYSILKLLEIFSSNNFIRILRMSTSQVPPLLLKCRFCTFLLLFSWFYMLL